MFSKKITENKKHKKYKKSKIKKTLLALISLLGISAAVSMLILSLMKNKDTETQDYDLVMESIEDIISKNKGKIKLSKDISLRIIKLQFEKAKLAHRDTLTEDNVCELNKKFNEHIQTSCKYSQDLQKCMKLAFGIDVETLKNALEVFNC